MKNELRSQLAALLSGDDPAFRRRAAEELAETSGFAPIAALAAALRDENKGVRDSALRYLSKIGNDNVARAAVEYIADENIVTRNLAAELLMRLKDHSIGALLPYLYDVDQDVRKFAVDLLGLIGNEETVDHIIPLLDDADENVVVSAAEALGNIRSPRALPHLIRVFKLHGYAQVIVSEALGKIGDASAGEFLLKYLSAMISNPDSDRLVIYSLVDALGLIGGESAIVVIRQNINSVTGNLRYLLLHTIIRILERHNRPLSELEEFRFELMEALRIENPAVQLSAVKALGAMSGREISTALLGAVGISDEINVILIPMLEHRDGIFRIIAEMAEAKQLRASKEIIGLLGTIASNVNYSTINDESVSDYASLLQAGFEFAASNWNEGSEEIRAAIVETMLRLDGDRAFEYLATVTEEPDPWLRIHVIELVAQLENIGIPNFIARFLSDDDEMVRETAASTLESKGYPGNTGSSLNLVELS